MCAGVTWTAHKEQYDQLLSIPYSSWGWEYKRRDRAVHSAAREVVSIAPKILSRPDGGRVYRLQARQKQAEQFGLHFLPDPNLSALETIPFWLPEVRSVNLQATSELDDQLIGSSTPIRWDALPGEKHFLLAPGRRPQLIIAAPGYAAQLAIEENALPVPQSVYLSLRLGAGHLLKDHLRHVEEFAAFCVGQKVKCKPLRGLSPVRLRDALIALDGYLAGASQREIADVIFDPTIVAADWDKGSKSYKSKTRRLIKKGLELMDYGYRELL